MYIWERRRVFSQTPVACKLFEQSTMRIILYIFLVLAFFACKSDKRKIIVNSYPNATRDTFNYESNYDVALDITDLKNFTDTSKFIARLRYNPVFKTPSVIELNEIANGIDLCVKQPVEMLATGEVANPNRSLPFNQLCYWYVDNEAQEVKDLFKPFSNGKKLRDIQCENCLDQSGWKIEIYDHGIYSSLLKNYKNKNDSVLISFILSKVKLSDKNLSIRSNHL